MKLIRVVSAGAETPGVLVADRRVGTGALLAALAIASLAVMRGDPQATVSRTG